MNPIEQVQSVADAINEGRPVVLLLGQDAWTGRGQPDAALIAALKRCGRHNERAIAAGFPALLQETLPQDFFLWLAEFYDHQPTPEWMTPLVALPWNAIFTTSIVPTLVRAFRSPGREVETVLTKEDNPAAPRNRRRLHVTYLFGRAGEQGKEAPPSNVQELRRRTTLEAASLLARTVETTTPLGVLLIDGFTCGRDWLSAEALAGALSAFRPRQVFWFGWDADTQSAEGRQLVGELSGPDGPVVLIRDRLANALRSLELAHRLDLSVPARVVSDDLVSLENGVLQLSAATRLKTSTAASIVDDTWLTPVVPLGRDAEYSEFCRFHGHVEDSRRLFEGIQRGFAIRRQVDDSLAAQVKAALANPARVKEPILIHGQSGSGKSLMLTRLACDIRATKRFPVLLASRTTRVPGLDEVEEFCLLAEDAGATATLLICDANAPVSRYRDLLRGFKSRGRSVIIVGSTYRILESSDSEQAEETSHLLSVPIELDDEELNALQELFRRFIGTAPKIADSQYLLATVYRILPNVRPHLAAGLAKEAHAAEGVLRTRGESEPSHVRVSGIAKALADIGLMPPRTLLENRIEEFLGCMSDVAGRLIDLVMVPAKLGCPVPIDILMRVVGVTESRLDITKLFSGIDLFRWSSDERDDVFIRSRLQLEADLICARRLGTAQAECEVAIKLLNNANPRSYDSCERRFVLDLVHRLGPDGPYGQRYARQYLEIARALSDLRTKKGIFDPSLMLQEATLRRRLFRDSQYLPEVDVAQILEEAREVVDIALDKFGASHRSGLKRMCANLRVERAAIYGFRAVDRLRKQAPLNEVWQFYLAARDSFRSAIYASDAYHATDICLWVPSDLLNGAEWDEVRRSELIADVYDALERVDPEQLDVDQWEQFEKRKLKVAQTLNNKELEQGILKSLEQSGSTAGIFLNAHHIGGPLGGDAPEPKDLKRAASAATYLKTHWNSILDDARCLRYLLRCRWLISTKSFLFVGERAPLPGNEQALLDLLELVERLRAVEGALGDKRTVYLQAVLQWRMGRGQIARNLWRELSGETEYSDSRRVVRQHVWTGASGTPQLFHGRIIDASSEGGRFRVRVEENRQEIELLHRDFRDVNLQRGSNVPGGFHIAFNYIGPVADQPIRRGGGG